MMLTFKGGLLIFFFGVAVSWSILIHINDLKKQTNILYLGAQKTKTLRLSNRKIELQTNVTAVRSGEGGGASGVSVPVSYGK